MADRALYLPHISGVIVGSDEVRPWVAPDAATAIAAEWRGQPAFRDAAEAVEWIDWARRQPWLPDGFALAHIDVHTDLIDEELIRVRVGANQLRDPAHQILRAHPGNAGPDEQILAACQAAARTDATRAWLIEHAGAVSRQRTDAAMVAVWTYGYHIAARDARAAYATQVARTVHATQTELSTSDRPGGGAAARARRPPRASGGRSSGTARPDSWPSPGSPPRRARPGRRRSPRRAWVAGC